MAIYPPLHELLLQWLDVVPQQGSCFGHAFSKTCQYGYNDTNVCVGFWEVSLKATQFALQKTITWTKKFNKGHNEQQRACLHVGLSHWKLKKPMKNRFTSKVILFKKPWSIRMPSIFVMGGKKFKNYKAVCQMHTHGQFAKWLLKPCFFL